MRSDHRLLLHRRTAIVLFVLVLVLIALVAADRADGLRSRLADTTPPAGPVLTLSESSPAEAVVGATLYYDPGEPGGTFDVSAVTADPDSGILRVRFPVVFGADATTDRAEPYTARYAWSTGAVAAATPRTVTATNGAGLASTATFLVAGDAARPSTVLSTQGSGPIVVTLAATDAGSGVAAIRYTTDGTDPTAVNGADYSGPFPVAATTEVRFRAYDRVGNAEAIQSRVVTPLAAAAVFRAAADAAVDASAPTTTFGSSARLRTGGSPVVRSYLRFHISGLTGTVTHARLRLYANSPIPSPGFEVHGVGDSSWSESSIAWANAPAPDAATTATSGPAAAGSWVEVDVTPLVTQDGDVSLALASAGAAALSLASRESGRPPQLVVESRLLRVGAFYYAWYGAARRHWSDGYVRHELTPPQAPQLGEYDSRDPAVLAQHFDWAHRNAIDFFAVSWWGAGEYSDVTTRDYLIRSPAIGRTKIAILYESLTNLGTVGGKVVFDDAVEAKLISDFDYLARTYFSSAHYQRVDGKPVVYLYVTRTYAGAYARAVADLRATIRARYGYDLYLVGDEVDWDGTPDAARIGVWDAITSYTMYSTRQAPGWPDDTRFLDGVRSRYAAFKAVADAEHVAFIPDAMPGYDDRGVRLSVDHYVLPFEVDPSVAPGTWSLFSSFLGVAGDFVDPNLRTMVVTTFNEWHEDTELEPIAPAAATSTPALYTQGYTFVAHGRSLLDVLRRYAQTWRTPAG